jgi:hypothetical protein
MILRDFTLTLRINDKCALLDYYAASSGNCLTTFQDRLLVPSSGVKDPNILDHRNGTDKLFQIVDKEFPLVAA